MAVHRDAPKTSKSEDNLIATREGYHETKGKILTPVHGFAGEDVLSKPPDTNFLRGNAKKPGSAPLPLSAKITSTNALAAFGLGGTTPRKKAK
jgi:hypothetical protein